MSFRIYFKVLLFVICPIPKGCAENQFAPFRVRGKQIDFTNLANFK